MLSYNCLILYTWKSKVEKNVYVDRGNIAAAAGVRQQSSFVQRRSESTFVLIVKNIYSADRVVIHAIQVSFNKAVSYFSFFITYKICYAEVFS